MRLPTWLLCGMTLDTVRNVFLMGNPDNAVLVKLKCILYKRNVHTTGAFRLKNLECF